MELFSMKLYQCGDFVALPVYNVNAMADMYYFPSRYCILIKLDIADGILIRGIVKAWRRQYRRAYVAIELVNARRLYD